MAGIIIDAAPDDVGSMRFSPVLSPLQGTTHQSPDVCPLKIQQSDTRYWFGETAPDRGYLCDLSLESSSVPTGWLAPLQTEMVVQQDFCVLTQVGDLTTMSLAHLHSTHGGLASRHGFSPYNQGDYLDVAVHVTTKPKKRPRRAPKSPSTQTEETPPKRTLIGPVRLRLERVSR